MKSRIEQEIIDETKDFMSLYSPLHPFNEATENMLLNAMRARAASSPKKYVALPEVKEWYAKRIGRNVDAFDAIDNYISEAIYDYVCEVSVHACSKCLTDKENL